MLEEIEELTNPKIKSGKKALGTEQLQLKTAVLAVLDAVRDESGKDAAVRLVFEPKSSRIDPAELSAMLLAHTSLESSASVNLTLVGADGKPTQKSLRQILQEWVTFRQQTVSRRSAHRLQRVQERMHVLEGRQLVLLHIDEVIRIIRQSDEPKPALVARFALSERQADDILEIRLRQLARLEAIRIEQELTELRAEQTTLEGILESPAVLRRTVIKEIEADAKAFGDARRTLIQADKRATAELRVADEPVTVVVSAKGWVRALKGHGVQDSALAFKAGDSLHATFACRSVDMLVVLGSNGRVYSTAVSALPGGRGDGTPITSLIELEAGTQAAQYFAGAADQTLLLASTGGYGLLALVGDLFSRQKAGKSYLTLEPGETPLAPVVADDTTQIACLSSAGRLLVFSIDEVRFQSAGGRGLTMIDLDKGDQLVGCLPFATSLRVLGTSLRGAKPRDEVFKPAALAIHVGKRGRKGKLVEGMKPRQLAATPPVTTG